MFDNFEVLASGLSATRTRVNTLASNIANAETTRTAEGGPYKRLDVVQVAVSAPADGFSNALDRMSMAKPKVQAVVADQTAPRLVYQPGHPDANEEGYVAYPNINVVQTMTDLTSATRAYTMMATAIENMRKMMQDATSISLRF